MHATAGGHHAGRGARGAAVVETSTEEFDDVIRTDPYGPFFCCRESIRRRQSAGGGGKTINVPSVHEAIPSSGNAADGELAMNWGQGA